mmetsp:Transcript_65142/g.204141  ORF Transcript_65142/g.204141 Transcript_65142/m.204141 type:complete len:295 (-) Transcript_65142:1313-2197(-)
MFQTPRDCPADPLKVSFNWPPNPSSPYRRAMDPAMRPPTARSVFEMGNWTSAIPLLPSTTCSTLAWVKRSSSNVLPLVCAGACRAAPAQAVRTSSSGGAQAKNLPRSTPSVFASFLGPLGLPPPVPRTCVAAGGGGKLVRTDVLPLGRSRSSRPMISSKDRKPRAARMVRTSSATKTMKLATCAGVPGNFFRNRSCCVATPTGQRFMWQTRAMMQPSAIIAMLPKPNSSLPIIDATTMSQPDFRPPSTRRVTRSRRPFSARTFCTSLRPCSQGPPACMMLLRGDAPVPPSWPEI